MSIIGWRLGRSKVIQQLPPAIFTLMKSTEPHSDVYFTFDIEVRSVQESMLVCGVWQRCNGCFATCYTQKC